MSQPQIEESIALMLSYVACIRALKDDRSRLDRAIAILEDRLREHEREHGFIPAEGQSSSELTEDQVRWLRERADARRQSWADHANQQRTEKSE